ncbi:MAG: hypothetical protein DI531_15545 [Brevundimonas sp.]|uniref:hypothetical protein n=1 Tax=Brevundimonas sp. TaxID=1871086 RepID=UPI000DB475DE|nr:hypothetical protein [Brevundimonas sp.]PZU71594.1 MAG: hypothetical protein DI531_15545 [Brevundimonas sp.]
MASLEKDIHPAIRAFTVRFRSRPTDKASIQKWIAKRVETRRPNSVRKSLNKQIERAELALVDLEPIKTHPNVELARQNARIHLKWATTAKAELLRMYPSARSKFVSKRRPRRPVRKRVGTLAREAQVFRRDEPEDHS